MEIYKQIIERIINKCEDEDYEYIDYELSRFIMGPANPSILSKKISVLLELNLLSQERIHKLEFNFRKRNPNMPVYHMGNREFGEKYITGLLSEIAPKIKTVDHKTKKVTKWAWDFELWSKKHGIKIKISFGAARASRTDKAAKGLVYQEKAIKIESDYPFTLNFQHLKDAVCNVYVGSGIWTDAKKFWVLAPFELARHKRHNPRQARGNKGEGQLNIKRGSIGTLDKFLVDESRLTAAIFAAYNRQVEHVRRLEVVPRTTHTNIGQKPLKPNPNRCRNLVIN